MSVESRMEAARKAFERARALGLPVEEAEEFKAWIEGWVAGEIGMSEVRARYQALLDAREAERKRLSAERRARWPAAVLAAMASPPASLSVDAPAPRGVGIPSAPTVLPEPREPVTARKSAVETDMGLLLARLSAEAGEAPHDVEHAEFGEMPEPGEVENAPEPDDGMVRDFDSNDELARELERLAAQVR